MRLQAKVEFTFRGVVVSPGDLFNAPDAEALDLINRSVAIPYNLEDPSQRSLGVIAASVPDVPPVSINPSSANVPAAGGSGSFTVTITGVGVSGTWIATKDAVADWLTYSPTAPQSVDGDVNYTVAPNPGTTSRDANIYVNGKTFAITQAASVITPTGSQ